MIILIHKEKREIVDGKEQIVSKARQHFVTDLTKDVQTLHGTIRKEELNKPAGSIIKTETGKEFFLINAEFTDVFKRLRKLPQTIPLKDIGAIIAETGLNNESIAVDGGLGSGALAGALAHIAKHVTAYEIREDCIKTAEENLKLLGTNNVEIKKKNMYDGIDESSVDVITIDVPQPGKVVKHAAKALKTGGWLVGYSPNTTQVQEFVDEINKFDTLLYTKTIEIIERQWKIKGRISHPKGTEISHSGFITFARKITA